MNQTCYLSPNFFAFFFLLVDALQKRFWGGPAQRGETGGEHSVVHFCTKLFPREKYYLLLDKECHQVRHEGFFCE